MDSPLYPLRFAPLLRRYVWGGHRLRTELGKPVPADQDCAESWEICDRGADQSRVIEGPLTGTTLHELIERFPRELLGRHCGGSQFPLLYKFLDCKERLSVQVHPNDEQAAHLPIPDLGKTEAWVILDALPGAALYAGLRSGVDEHALRRAIRDGNVESCLHRIQPSRGDCLFIPAGTVHALGEGLLVAEIQEASDTTFRLFDWNRAGADGKPRPLHIDQGIAAIDFSTGPRSPQVPTRGANSQQENLVSCGHFVLDRWQITSAWEIACDDRFHGLSVIEGAVELTFSRQSMELPRGATVLLPAKREKITISPRKNSTLLDWYLP